MSEKMLDRIKRIIPAERGADAKQLPEVWDGNSKVLPDDNGETPAVKRRRVLRKKLRRGGTAAVVGLSVTLASLFSSPSEIMQQQIIRNLNPDYAVEIMIDEENEADPEDRKKVQEGGAPGGVFRRFAQAIKSFVIGLPAPVKACVCVPLWAAGFVLVQLASFLFSSLVSPLLGHIISLLLFALALLAVYVLTVKCIFPHMPLRRILSWKNIIRVLAGAVVLKAVDIVLPMFWNRYFTFRNIILLVLGALIMGLIIFRYLKRHKKRRELFRTVAKAD